MDSIVFNQTQLDSAIEAGFTSICLCDGDYRLNKCENISFLAIGTVTVKVSAARAECEAVNMRFLNFEPEFAGGNTRAFVPLKYSGLTNSGSYSSSIRSSGGSFSSSYRLWGSYYISSGGSFSSSYRFAGSYSLSGSYFKWGSRYLSGSYRLRTCFSSSYATSYRLASSYAYSFAGSFLSSFRSGFKARSSRQASAESLSDGVPEYIPVFGYGIDLI